MPEKNPHDETDEDIVYDSSDTSEGVNSDLALKIKKVKEELKNCQKEKQ